MVSPIPCADASHTARSGSNPSACQRRYQRSKWRHREPIAAAVGMSAPDAACKLVAGKRTSSSGGACARLIPIPTAYPPASPASIRMPDSFRPQQSTSFGHLSANLYLAPVPTPYPAPQTRHEGELSRDAEVGPADADRNIKITARRLPDTPLPRPRPHVCRSAVTTSPCGHPARSASAFVPSISSKTRRTYQSGKDPHRAGEDKVPLSRRKQDRCGLAGAFYDR